MENNGNDNRRRVLVTGASKGIGLETAKLLLAEGCKVVVAARGKEELERHFGDEAGAVIVPRDLSDPCGVADFVRDVLEAAGPVSGLVHCAGAQATGPAHMIKEAKLREIFNLNTFGAILLVSGFSKKNAFAEGASFVLISSLAAHEGAFGKSMYAASKAALEGFVSAVAPELAVKGIRINCVAPGVVVTPMVEAHFAQLTEEQRLSAEAEYPLGLGRPADVAAMVKYLLGGESRWVTGRTFILDGGHLVRKC